MQEMEGGRPCPYRLGEGEYNNPIQWGGNGEEWDSYFLRILLRRVVVVEKRLAVVRATTRRAAHVINRVGGVLLQQICRHSQTPHRTRPWTMTLAAPIAYHAAFPPRTIRYRMEISQRWGPEESRVR
jgi:hypothetical protein